MKPGPSDPGDHSSVLPVSSSTDDFGNKAEVSCEVESSCCARFPVPLLLELDVQASIAMIYFLMHPDLFQRYELSLQSKIKEKRSREYGSRFP
jgi:hypothetical protein